MGIKSVLTVADCFIKYENDDIIKSHMKLPVEVHIKYIY